MDRGIAMFLLVCLVSYAVAASITRSPSKAETGTSASVIGWQVQASAEKQLAPEEMIEDVDTLVRTLEEVHPDLYYYTPKTEISGLKDTLSRSLNKAHSEREFMQVIARLVAKFGDAHTSVSFALPSRKAYIDQGGLFFPLDIKQSPRGILIKQNYSDDPSLSLGDRILSINGVNVDTLFAEFLNEVSGETLAFRTIEVERNIKSMLWIHDIMAPYKIEFESKQSGQRRAESVQGITAQVLSQRQTAAAGPAAKVPYRYVTLAEGIGYLNFRSMGGDNAAFEAFLEGRFLWRAPARLT